MNGDGLMDDSAMEIDDSSSPPHTITAPTSSSSSQQEALLQRALASPPPPPSPVEAAAVDFDRNPVAIERVLSFGQDLQALYGRLTASKPNDQLKNMLQVYIPCIVYTGNGIKTLRRTIVL